MPNFVIVSNNIVENIIVADSLEIAQNCYPNHECYEQNIENIKSPGETWIPEV